MQSSVSISIGQRHVRSVVQQKVHEIVVVVGYSDDQRGSTVEIVAIDLREEIGGAVDVAASG